MAVKHLDRNPFTLEMNINRRNLLVRGGGAVTAALMARPGIMHAGSDGFAAKAESQRGKVRIRDVQSASIADEYVCNLIKITTDSGLYGIGEARCKIPVAKQVKAFMELVVGEDPLRVDYLTRKMMAPIKRPTLQDIGVISGIETALWDLAGKILNTPTYNLLGGACRDKIKVYYDLAPADTPKTTEPALWVESARRAKKEGFRAMKMDIYRGGGDVPEWVRILQAIRVDVGPDMLLGVEFHWRLNSEQTDRFIAMTEDLNLWFIEDPMRYDANLAHYQRLTAAGKIPIVALEQMLTLKSFHEMLEKRMCTIIEPDAQYCGGLLALKRVADLGELYGMDTLCHNMCSPVGTYAQAHACATIQKFVAMENACAVNVIQHEGSLYQDGYLLLNDKPGLGIELNEEYCRKHLSKGTTFFGT
jgi:L-alanine-DL-glutamate epimerase-like enolase superfamily enzyme